MYIESADIHLHILAGDYIQSDFECVSVSFCFLLPNLSNALCLREMPWLVYASRSSLASKFIAALWAFCVYYYCGSRIHSFLSFFHLFYLFHPLLVLLLCFLFFSFFSYFYFFSLLSMCIFSFLTLIHLQNVCFVFSHAINFNLAKNRKQRSHSHCSVLCAHIKKKSYSPSVFLLLLRLRLLSYFLILAPLSSSFMILNCIFIFLSNTKWAFLFISFIEIVFVLGNFHHLKMSWSNTHTQPIYWMHWAWDLSFYFVSSFVFVEWSE